VQGYISVLNPDLQVMSSRKVHGTALYCSDKADFWVTIHHW